MRRMLTEIPLSVIARLLNARDSEMRTPLCLAATWKNTNPDSLIEMAQFVIVKLKQPGVLPFIFNVLYPGIIDKFFWIFSKRTFKHPQAGYIHHH